MPIGTSGVTDYANTTSGVAGGVIALGGIGGQGVVDQISAAPPTYIATESNDRLDTESSDNLITQ